MSTAPPAGVTVVRGSLRRVRSGHGYAFTEEPPPPPHVPVKSPARVARMLALAHRIQADIDDGRCRDRADAARHLGLTRARITQLMNLILLAPDLQEEVLLLKSVNGIEPLTERAIRAIAQTPNWQVQRGMWREMRARRAGQAG